MANLLQRLFGFRKPKGIDREIPTVPISSEPARGVSPPPPQEPRSEFPQHKVGIYQSIGKQRDHNEDSLFALTSFLAGEQTYVPFGLYIVADGMGGHQHGEVASGLAVRTIANQVIRKLLLVTLMPRPSPPKDSIQEILLECVQEAHQTIMKDSPGSGTTLTTALILNGQMTIAHVGDSRAYHITPDGVKEVLTRDHSLVMRMIELGQLTEEEAAYHPQRNVLYRALGQGDLPAPDLGTFPLPDKGHILLCSDGLWGVVGKEELVRIVNSAPDPQVACQELIDAANLAGGPDNISAILIELPD